MGAIYGHSSHLDLRTMTIFDPPLTQGSTCSLKNFSPGDSEEVVQMDGQTDG